MGIENNKYFLVVDLDDSLLKVDLFKETLFFVHLRIWRTGVTSCKFVTLSDEPNI